MHTEGLTKLQWHLLSSFWSQILSGKGLFRLLWLTSIEHCLKFNVSSSLCNSNYCSSSQRRSAELKLGL